MRQFIILDRDGTIIVEKHYLVNPDQVELLSGVIEGLAAFRQMGFGLIVVTNQAGIGRGYFTLAQLTAVHQRLQVLLEQHNIVLDAIYYCPHHPQDGCDCRKPKTGLLLQAAHDFHFDPQTCLVVGDKECDISLGNAVGATTFLVKTGYGDAGQAQPTYTVENLNTMAAIIADWPRLQDESRTD